MKISFVIPCYGSENTIRSVVDEIRDTATKRDCVYEIILVNDSSPDNVWSVIKELAREYSNVIGIDLAANFGQHSALMAGYRTATGDLIVSLDDDGQTPADESFKLIDLLNDDYDVVFAAYASKKHNCLRNLGTRINDLMAEILIKKPKHLHPTSFFAAKRFVIDEIIRYKNPYTYILGLLLRSTNKITSVPVSHREREIGRSGYTMSKLLSLWINGFTAFSVKPLRLASLIGVLLALAGFAFGAVIVVRKLLNPDIPLGYSSMMTILLFVGGLLLMTMGFIGEYIGRIYISLNKSPQYVIRSMVNQEKNDK